MANDNEQRAGGPEGRGRMFGDAATRWHYEPGSFVPLAREAADGALAYVVTDHLGTPRELFGEDGALVWAMEHGLWGEPQRLWTPEAANDNARRAGGPEGGGRVFGALALKDEPEALAARKLCPIRFQGQWEDEETGFSYNRFRHYDALAGQYASPDPLGFLLGEGRSAYVRNPLGWVDPFGLQGSNPLVPTPTGKGAAGELTGPNIPGGRQTGLSTGAGGGGITNPAVQEAYDQVPEDKRSFYHGKCCEADALSKAANKQGVKNAEELRGLTQGTNFRAYNSYGRYLPACSSCRRALDYLGIK